MGCFAKLELTLFAKLVGVVYLGLNCEIEVMVSGVFDMVDC